MLPHGALSAVFVLRLRYAVLLLLQGVLVKIVVL
jgi:hypothetical protein